MLLCSVFIYSTVAGRKYEINLSHCQINERIECL